MRGRGALGSRRSSVGVSSVTPGEEASAPVLAVDPGRDKCGLAVVERNGRVLYQGIVATAKVAEAAAGLVGDHGVGQVVVGDRTAAKEVCRALGAARPPMTPTLVDEHRSSEEGRRRFFRDNPPRGWRRLLPISLQTPPHPYDDYVAVLIAERYLASQQR